MRLLFRSFNRLKGSLLLKENSHKLLQGVESMPSGMSTIVIKGARGLGVMQDTEPVSSMSGY